jgi:hypothetical protein
MLNASVGHFGSTRLGGASHANHFADHRTSPTRTDLTGGRTSQIISLVGVVDKRVDSCLGNLRSSYHEIGLDGLNGGNRGVSRTPHPPHSHCPLGFESAKGRGSRGSAFTNTLSPCLSIDQVMAPPRELWPRLPAPKFPSQAKHHGQPAT